MRSRIVAVALFTSLTLTLPAVGQPLDPKKVERGVELNRLQGGWVAKYLVTEAGVEPYPLQGRGLAFADATFVRTEGRRTLQSGTVRLDPAGLGLDLVVEQHTSWDVEAGPNESKVPFTIRCSYRVAGDLLSVCVSGGKDRPDDLKPGTGRTVVVYERVKAFSTLPRPRAVVDVLDDAVSVDGTWILTSHEPADLPRGMAERKVQRTVWCIEDDRWTCWMDGKHFADLTAKFDPGCRVTLTVRGVTTGPKAIVGQIWKGVYKAEQDRLTLCVDPTGREFPTGIAARPDRSRVVYVMDRAKGVQPEEEGGAGGVYTAALDPSAAAGSLPGSSPATEKNGSLGAAGARWEYKAVTEGYGANDAQTAAALEPLGKDGWELVTVVQVPGPGGIGNNRYVFKRLRR